jgi:hypothetical protein
MKAQMPSIPAFVRARADAGYFQSEDNHRIRWEKNKMAERKFKVESKS